MFPLRILELRSTYRGGGGPDKTILLSAHAHSRERFDVRCLYLRGADDQAFNLGARAKALNVPFEEVLERGRFDLRPVLALGARIRAFRPHIIHTHDYKSDILGYLVRPSCRGATLLATAHGWTLDSSRMNVYNWLDRRILTRFDHTIAVSKATRRRMIDAGIPPSRISLLYNGIDTNQWRPAPSADAGASLKKALDIPRSARLLGYIGRLSPEKDIPLAMEAARQVVRAAPDTHIVVVGEGVEQVTLQDLIRSLNIEHRVHALGYRPVTPSLYHALDVYFMSSKTEGLPNTLLEAMACGRPSVVTDVGGIPELVGTSDGAILCPRGDAEALARGILALLGNSGRAFAMGKAARARIEEAFSFQERLSRIESLYISLVERKPGCPFPLESQ